MNKLTAIIFTALLAIFVVSGIIIYTLTSGAALPADVTSSAASSAAALSAGSLQHDGGAVSIFSELLATNNAPAGMSAGGVVTISLRFACAAMLAALLAFRPRRNVPVNRRNPYVAQTQILLAVVAASMMIIVGDSAARAFGIFAAASLVSFRTNIRDPKEIAVLLVCLGVGLAAGVGRLDLAVVLSLFVLVTLTIMESLEQRQAFRSMEVCVETRNLDYTHNVLKRIFEQQNFATELRQINRDGASEENSNGKVVYHVKLNPLTDMDRLSERIIAADRQNIGSIEWEQKKSTTYIYN